MTSHKLRIVFFIANLAGGGAERTLVNILRNLDRNRFSPVLVLFDKEGALLPLCPADVEIYSLEEMHGRGKSVYGFQWLRLLPQLRTVLLKTAPQVVLSFLWYPNALALLTCLLGRFGCRTVISERTSTFIYESRFENMLRTLAIRMAYPRADMIIAPSRGIAEDLAAGSLHRDRIRVIHNPVDIDMLRQKALEKPDHPWFGSGCRNVITAIGRLGPEKGFDYLIRALAILAKTSVECRLVIVGEGKERRNLERLIGELKLEDKVQLVGFQQNPYKFLARSTIFVLSSLYEGFPNVLLEALSLGIPSVATRCPTGPEEIITAGVDGILVPTNDEDALAEGIAKLLRSEGLRAGLAAAGRKRAEQFRMEKIVRQFEQAIEDVCAVSAGN